MRLLRTGFSEGHNVGAVFVRVATGIEAHASLGLDRLTNLTPKFNGNEFRKILTGILKFDKELTSLHYIFCCYKITPDNSTSNEEKITDCETRKKIFIHIRFIEKNRFFLSSEIN